MTNETENNEDQVNHDAKIKNLREKLAGGSYCVVFEKRDGTMRDMYCTTNHDIIGKMKPSVIEKLNEEQAKIESGEKKARATSPEMFRVFDMEKMDWRSFSYEQVQSVEPFDQDGKWLSAAIQDKNN